MTDRCGSIVSDWLRSHGNRGSRGRYLSPFVILMGLLLEPVSSALAADAPSPSLSDASCLRLLLQFRKPPPLGIDSIRTLFRDLAGVTHFKQGIGSLPNSWVLTIDGEVLASPEKLEALRSKLRAIGTDRGMGGTTFIERSAVWTSPDVGPADLVSDAKTSGLDAVHATEAAVRITKIPHTPTVVAVVDSGIRYDHIALRNEMWSGNGAHGKNFSGGPPDDTGDYTAHGTNVAGALAATSDDSTDVTSIPWKKGVLLVIAKASGGEDPDGCTDDISDAIDYAAKEANASIINLSLMSPTYSAALLAELTLLEGIKQRTLVIAAVGNRPFNLDLQIPGQKEYPTAYQLDNVLSVQGVNDSGLPRGSFGRQFVQLAAPADIYTTDNSDDTAWVNVSGTSFAAPQVSAAAALISAYAPGWGYHKIRQYLVDSAHNSACDLPNAPPQSTPLCGKSESGGILNVDAATGAPVQLDSPASGDRWSEGVSHQVRWKPYFQTKLCPQVDLYLSLNDGLNWSAPQSFPQGLQTLGGNSTVTVVIPADVPKSSTARLALRCHDTARLESWSDTFSID